LIHTVLISCLGLLGDVTDHFDLVPAAGEDSAGLAEVKAGDIGLLVPCSQARAVSLAGHCLSA
jgi:hypothetical protein